MTGAEVRKMQDVEITSELARLRTKIYDLRTQGVTEKVENTAQSGEIRRDIARLLTERTVRSKSAAGATK